MQTPSNPWMQRVATLWRRHAVDGVVVPRPVEIDGHRAQHDAPLLAPAALLYQTFPGGWPDTSTLPAAAVITEAVAADKTTRVHRREVDHDRGNHPGIREATAGMPENQRLP